MGNKRFIFTLLLLVGQLLSAHTWQTTPTNAHAQTIGFQGVFSSQGYFARYTKSFTACTGEIVKQHRGLELINRLHVGPELDEVVFAGTQHGSLKSHAYHWFYSKFGKGSGRTPGIIEQPAQITVGRHTIDISQMNMGQRGDIEVFRKKLASADKNAPKICWGISRGSAATVTGLAQLNAEQAGNVVENNSIKMVVLEGSPDSMDHVIEKRYPNPVIRAAVWQFLSCTKFEPNGISPLSMLDSFPLDVPVVLITSEIDKAVPAVCTKNLAVKLAEKRNAAIARGADTQKNAVYLLELKASSHTGYTFDNAQDFGAYRELMHGLYAQYDLPYISEYVEDSTHQLIESCRQTVC